MFNPTSFIFHTEGNIRHVGINSTGSTSPLYIASSGTLTTTPSDERLKTNINALPSCIDKIKQLNPISFNWIDTEENGERVHLGFTAQNVQATVPEAVGQGDKMITYHLMSINFSGFNGQSTAGSPGAYRGVGSSRWS